VIYQHVAANWMENWKKQRFEPLLCALEHHNPSFLPRATMGTTAERAEAPSHLGDGAIRILDLPYPPHSKG
jgi:hypothetical protein